MKKKLLKISFTLSFISLATTFLINIQIAKHYLATVGKTRALFSLIEMVRYGYQYYVVVLGLLALIGALLATVPANKKIIAIALAILSIAFVFSRVWRLLI